MGRLPSVASLFDSGIFVFGKEWKHLTSAVILLSLPLYLLSLGMETNSILFLPYLILALVIGPLISIITTAIIHYRYDRDITIHSQGLYKYIHDRFFPALWTSILATIVVVLSMVLLAIPLAILGIIYAIAKPALIIAGTLTTFGLVGTIVLIVCAVIISVGAGVYLMFSLPTAILEKKSGLDAINSSIRLVRGRWWNIFGRVVLLQLIATFIAGIISVFSGAAFGFEGLGYLITTLLQQVAVLPITIAMIVLYLDIRGKPSPTRRKEVVKAKQTSVRKRKAPVKRKVAKKKTAKRKSTKKKTTRRKK